MSYVQTSGGTPAGSCCSGCGEGKPCCGTATGLAGFLDDIMSGVTSLFSGGDPPKRGKPQPSLAAISSVDDVLTYASAGFWAAKAKGWPKAADLYRKAYWNADARQQGAQSSLLSSPEEIAALRAADMMATTERNQASAQIAAGLPVPAVPDQGLIARSQSFIGDNLTWLLPSLGIGIFLLWEKNTKSGKRYARKHGASKVITLHEYVGGSGRKKRRRR